MGLGDTKVARGPSRIVVADDHPRFRSALMHILDGHPGLEVVAEAANGRQALELCRRLTPDLVLMDLCMPELDGIAATRAIRGEVPDTRVLILTALDESAGLSDFLEADTAEKSGPGASATPASRRRSRPSSAATL